MLVLEQLQDFAALRPVAEAILAAPLASAEARAQAQTILQKPAPAEQDMDLARAAVRRGLALQGEARRAAMDTALLAFERATKSRAVPVALNGMNDMAFVDPSHLVTTARVEPEGTLQPVVISLEQGEKSSEITASLLPRLLPGGKQAPHTSVTQEGVIVTSLDGEGQVVPALDAPARQLPRGVDHVALPGRRVLIANPDGLSIQDAVRGQEVLPKTAVSLREDALKSAIMSEDSRFWVVCGSSGGGVAAVDGQIASVAVNMASTAACSFDPSLAMLATLRAVEGSAGHVKVTIFDLPAKKEHELLVPAPKALENASLGILRHFRAVSIQLGSKTVYAPLDGGPVSSRPPAPSPVGPPALRGVSVGQAGDSPSAVRALRKLAEPPRIVVEPAFASLAAWTANGVLSFDGKTVAAYTSTKDNSDIQLVIADADTMHVRRRISVQFGLNWLTAFFLDNRRIVVQSYPNYEVYDAFTGEYLAPIENQEARILFDRFLVNEGAVWNLAPPKSENRRVDLGLAQVGSWSGKEERVWTKGKKEPGRVIMAKDSVTIEGMSPPNWLYCRLGEWLAPWPVCEHRFLR